MRISGCIVAVAMLVGITGPMTPGWAAPSLESSVWLTTVTPDQAARAAGQLPFDDRLSFSDGKVLSRAADKKGFMATTYILSEIRPGTMSLTIQQQSLRQGNMVWTLDVAGPAMQGMLVWTTPEGDHRTFAVVGHRESGPAPSP